MSIWKDEKGGLHYDMDGAALTLPCWPQGMTKLSDAEAYALQYPQKTLAQAQAERIAKLQADCQTAIIAGFESSALGTVHQYPSQIADQQNLLSAVAAAQGAVSGWTASIWCAVDGVWSFVEHSAKQVAQVNTDWVADRTALQQKYANLVFKVNVATSVDAVSAIVWSS